MEACGARDRVTDSTGEWQVVGRPYITNGGKNAHVRVRRVDSAEVTMIRALAEHRLSSVIARNEAPPRGWHRRWHGPTEYANAPHRPSPCSSSWRHAAQMNRP